MTSIIPAIDLINGKCVRLTEGDYNKETVYDPNPIGVAKRFEDQGAQRIHIIDLDAAKTREKGNINVINSIIKETNLEVQVGGGLRKSIQVERLFDIGAAKVIVGSKAQRDRPGTIRWLKKFGHNRIIIGADTRNGKIAINGWLDTSNDDITEFMFYYTSHGASQFLCTDIMKDGKMLGPSIELYKSLIKKFPQIDLIASGGVSSEEDVKELKSIGINSIILGKAIYEEAVNVQELIQNY